MNTVFKKGGAVECTLDDILFPVELRDNPRKTNREYSKVVTGVINGEEIDINYCSPVYRLIPNSTIFLKIEEVLWMHNVAYTARYSHINHARFYARYVIDDPRFTYRIDGSNDEIRFTWYHQHSYNGLTKYKGMAGYYRLVCSNGLMLPVKEMKEYNLLLEGKHTRSIVHTLDEFNALFLNLVDRLDTIKRGIGNRYETLGGRVVENPRERIAEVLTGVGIRVVENSKHDTLTDIMNRIEREANSESLGYGGRVNDWLIYNGINQYLNDNQLNIAAPERRMETDSRVLEYLLHA